MKFYDLEGTLCEQIELLTNPDISYEDKMKQAEISTMVCSLSKQLINYADVVLRGEKLVMEGKLAGSRIDTMIHHK